MRVPQGGWIYAGAAAAAMPCSSAVRSARARAEPVPRRAWSPAGRAELVPGCRPPMQDHLAKVLLGWDNEVAGGHDAVK